MSERMFPIQDATDIPWKVIAPYEKWALKNHDQSLERLAQRQGLGASEAVAVLEMRRWMDMKLEFARQRLAELVGNSPAILLERAEKAEARVAELEGALRISSQAVDDWLHTYAGEMCDDAAVAQTNQRIGEACGTLAYIADVQQGTHQVLSSGGPTSRLKSSSRTGQLTKPQAWPQLLNLIGFFNTAGLSMYDGEIYMISDDTAVAAEKLLWLLPRGTPTPKTCPDEDGALLLVWEKKEETMFLIVDGWRLHIVERAATKDASYHDDIEFDGEVLPNVVADSVGRFITSAAIATPSTTAEPT